MEVVNRKETQSGGGVHVVGRPREGTVGTPFGPFTLSYICTSSTTNDTALLQEQRVSPRSTEERSETP